MKKTVCKLFKKYEETIMYVFIGGCTTIVSLVSFFVLADIFGVYYQAANIISWVLSVTFAYFTNKAFVFRAKYTGARDTIIEAGKFVLCRISSLLIEILSMFFFVQICGMNDSIVKLMNQVIVFVMNYIFSKFLVFRNS